MLRWKGDVPRQQIGDAVDGMVRDDGQDVSKVELRIQSVKLGRANERVDGSGSFSSRVGAGKEIVLSVQCDSPQRAFCGVIVYLDESIIEVESQRRPSCKRVANRARHIALARE